MFPIPLRDDLMVVAPLLEQEVEDAIGVASSGLEPAEHYEVVAGQFVEEPPLGAREVWIASEMTEAFILFNAGKQLGKMYEEMLFVLKAHPRLRRRPDLAFVSAERWPVNKPAPPGAAWDVVPDLVVEIISPTDHVDDLMSKIEEYFAAGVRLVWVVYPSVRKLYAYETPNSIQILDAGDTLSGGEILVGFQMPLSRIFVEDSGESGPAVN